MCSVRRLVVSQKRPEMIPERPPRPKESPKSRPGWPKGSPLEKTKPHKKIVPWSTPVPTGGTRGRHAKERARPTWAAAGGKQTKESARPTWAATSGKTNKSTSPYDLGGSKGANKQKNHNVPSGRPEGEETNKRIETSRFDTKGFEPKGIGTE